MMNDTVREELESKIMAGVATRLNVQAPPMPEQMPQAARPTPIASPPVTAAAKPMMAAPLPVKRQETAGLVAPKTSPTLVGFQSKNAALPDWRIQLQNAVQQRKGGNADAIATDSSNTETQYPTNGGAALKAEIVQRVQPAPPVITDQRVANAMRRIEDSRNAFTEQPAPKKPMVSKPAQMRPFGVVQPKMNASTAVAAAPARIVTPPKPKLVSPQIAPHPEKRITNKLTPIEIPIEMPQETLGLAKPPIIEKNETAAPVAPQSEFAEIKRIRIRAENSEIEPANMPDAYPEEIEDLAPVSMRFGAGLFDVIIGGFASMLILSPIAFSRGDWFSTAGLLTFAGTCAIVMFLYMTICLGFFGKTMGMRLFSLELVDAVENEYPTLHQAAVNSSLFLISLGLAGAGFVTMFYNEERRAVHDLLSGTILVREF